MKNKLNWKTKTMVAILFPGFVVFIMILFIIAAILYLAALILKLSGILDAIEFLFYKLSQKLKKHELNFPNRRKS